MSVLTSLEVDIHGTYAIFLFATYFSYKDVMKYASSTLLFTEYMDQKTETDTLTTNDLVKTTLEFLIGNEFVAVIQPGQDDVEKIDPLANGTVHLSLKSHDHCSTPHTP